MSESTVVATSQDPPTAHGTGELPSTRYWITMAVALVPAVLACIGAMNVQLALTGMASFELGVQSSVLWLVPPAVVIVLLVLAPMVLVMSRVLSGVRAALIGLLVWIAAQGMALQYVTADPPSIALGVAVPTVIGLLTYAGVRHLLHPRLGARLAGIPGRRLPLAPSSASAAHGMARNRVMLVVWIALGAVILVDAVVAVLVRAEVPWISIALLVITLAAVAPMAITTTVSARGVVVRSWLGIRLVRVPIERIARAEHALVDVTDWGPPGVHADPDRPAILPASGPALIVTLVDGRELVVGTHRPDDAAAVLMTHLQQRASA